MKSSKITSNNPYVTSINQRYVTAKDYNLLRDDITDLLSGSLGDIVLKTTTAPVDYLHSALSVGTYGAANALIDTTLVDNIAFTVNMRTGTNKTTADTSCMAAYIGIGNTADTIHAKLQGLLVTNAVGFDCFDAYCVQGNMSITDTMATHDGNANLVAGSFKVSIADGKTATGNVSPLYLVIGQTDATTGDTATGTLDAIRVENNGTQTDSVINVGGATTITAFATIDAGAASKCVAPNTSSTAAQTPHFALKIVVGGTAYWAPLYTCTDGTGATFN